MRAEVNFNTFRTDIRKRQGSRRPVEALADILHTNGNLAPHRTVCCKTSSLLTQTNKEISISSSFGPQMARDARGTTVAPIV